MVLVRFLKRFVRLYLFRLKFRRENKDNRVFPVNVFPMQYVSVGRHTYGALNVQWQASDPVHLKIGHYCSIGPDVQFLLGGGKGHNYKRISTFPFQTLIYGQKTVPEEKNLDIIVGDDVWIGYGTLIMSGVTIGQGAVIGARSIVTKDIPPYSIYVGNKVIKKRFDEEIIEKLMTIDYSNIEHKKDDEFSQFCQTELSPNNIEYMIDMFKK